jgi:hypothetical protein
VLPDHNFRRRAPLIGRYGAKEFATLLKNALMWVVLVITTLILLECGSALLLYHRWSTLPDRFIFTGDLARLATLELGKRLGQMLGVDLPWLTAAERRVTSVPAPFFVPDAELGYTVRPGSYQILIDAGVLKYQFHATVWPDGSRATSYLPHQARRRLYIFGDSVTWGWPNEDEATFAWLLQQSLLDYSVLNFAQNGYGNVHALIQLRRLSQILESDDIVLLAYADYFNIRNVAAPSRMREFDNTRDTYRYGNHLTHPKAVLKQRILTIEYVPLLCEHSHGYCDQENPSPNQMFEVTQTIFANIVNMVKARVVVGYINGRAQDDPVIAFLRQRGVDIIDMRPSSEWYERDSLPFDRHPGPIAHYHYFKKILNYLEGGG